MSDKIYSCDICGKRYKNSKSLRTHKYSYHRQKVISSLGRGLSQRLVSENDSDHGEADLGLQSSIDTGSIYSDSNELQDKVFDMEVDVITMKGQLDSVQTSVYELEELIRSVKRDISQESKRIKDGKDGYTQIPFKEFDDWKSAVESNKTDISGLEYRINLIEEKQNGSKENHEQDLKDKDLLDELKVITKLFSQQEFESVVNDIPTLRRVLKFILEAVDSDELSEEQFQLLQEISVSSKSAAKVLVHDNFSRLVTIFRKLEKDLEALFETEQSDHTDDSQGTESQESETEVAENEDDGSSIQSEHSDSLSDNSTIEDTLYKEQSQEYEH